MQKLCVALACVTAASALAPPRIELDMAGIHRDTTKPHDYAARCPANEATLATCPFPIAKAYDHKDGDISHKVVTKVYLMDQDGTPCENKSECTVTSVDFSSRATYIFEYDVEDAGGNAAETAVFELVLDDIVPPTIEICDSKSETWEAAGSATLCNTDRARDNVDDAATMQSRLRYQLYRVADDRVSSTRICPPLAASNEWNNYENNLRCAQDALNTDNVGHYLLTLKACDKAGTDEDQGASKYGFEYSANPPNDNCVTANKAFVIEDTTPPEIVVLGYGESSVDRVTGEPLYHECSEKYSETYPEANKPKLTPNADHYDVVVNDALDDNLGKTIRPVRTGEVDVMKVDTYTLRYDATDSNGRVAAPKARRVQVIDTRKPRITLNGEPEMQHNVTQAPDFKKVEFNDPMASCSDDCDQQITLSEPVWDRPWNDRVIGCYTRTYTCRDASSNSASATRRVCLQDHGDPVITVMGDADMTIEASNTVEYTDEGATCRDYVDGVLSHAVEVSGNVVNLRVPGFYQIKYDCMDLSNRAAEQKHRNVTVQDTTCPKVTLKGANVVYLEAGFKYKDAGATASDTLDGDISYAVRAVNDNVNHQDAFHSRRSCREIKQTWAEAGDGQYYITTFSDEDASFKRVKVYCDMSGKGLTLYPILGNSDVLTQSSQGDCGKFGLKMLQVNAVERKSARALLKDELGAAATDRYLPNSASTSPTNTYVCSTNDVDELDTGDMRNTHAMNHLMSHDRITEAELGKFIISYHVKDKAKNDECQPAPTRTVIVKDTLPPVISLHVRGADKTVAYTHQSASQQKGLGDVVNDAHEKTWDHDSLAHFSDSETGQIVNFGAAEEANSLMAEHGSSVSYWAPAAGVAAITGLALLGFASRKRAYTVVEV